MDLQRDGAGGNCGGYPGDGRGSGPRSVLDRIKWPVAFHPREDRVVEDRIERGAVRAAVVNAGNANAETGEQGLADLEPRARGCFDL